MKKQSLIICIILILCVAFVVTGLWIAGFFSTGTKFAVPPCDELPNYSAAKKALSDNSETVKELKQAAPDIEISAANPCGAQDRGVIKIKFTTDAEQKAIDTILNKPTFGIPVLLERM